MGDWQGVFGELGRGKGIGRGLTSLDFFSIIQVGEGERIQAWRKWSQAFFSLFFEVSISRLQYSLNWRRRIRGKKKTQSFVMQEIPT